MLNYVDKIFDSNAFIESENITPKNQFQTLNVENVKIGNQCIKDFETFVDTTGVLNFVNAILDNKQVAYINNQNELKNQNSKINVIEGNNIRCFMTTIDTKPMIKYVDAVLDSRLFILNDENLATNESKSEMIFKFKIPENELISNSIDFHQVIVNESNNAAYVYLSTTVSSLKLAKQLVDELYEMGINNVEIIQQNEKEYEDEIYIENE